MESLIWFIHEDKFHFVKGRGWEMAKYINK